MLENGKSVLVWDRNRKKKKKKKKTPETEYEWTLQLRGYYKCRNFVKSLD